MCLDSIDVNSTRVDSPALSHACALTQLELSQIQPRGFISISIQQEGLRLALQNCVLKGDEWLNMPHVALYSRADIWG